MSRAFMSRAFIIAVLLLLSGILLASAPSIGAAPDTMPTTRDDTVVLDRFSDNNLMHLDTFISPGTNASATVDLPTGCRVVNASVDLEGILNDFQITYHNDHKDSQNSAWIGETSKSAEEMSPTDLQTIATKYTTTQYQNVNSSDNVRLKFTPKTDNFPFSIHQIHVSDLNMDYIEPYAEGFIHFKYFNNINLFIWNYTDTSWKAIDKDVYTGTGIPASDSCLGSKITSGFSNYFDHGNRAYLLVDVEKSLYDAQYTMELDYVSLNTSYTYSSFPNNASLDVGNDGDSEWSLPGVFRSNTTVSGATLVSELQEHVDAGSGATATIPFALTSSSVGKIKLDALSIEYYMNTGPIFSGTIPGLIFDEGAAPSASNDITLSSYFSDDHTTTFRVSVECTSPTPALVWRLTDDDTIRFTSPDTDFYGTESYRITVFDTGIDGVFNNTDDRSNTSNWFDVHVTPTNDPPVIVSVGGVSPTGSTIMFTDTNALTQDTAVDLEIEVSDPDGDGFTASLNDTSFLDVADGHIVGVPTNDDVGIHHILLTVEDANASLPKLGTSVNLTVTVNNVNDLPTITSLVPIAGDPILPTGGILVFPVREDSWNNYTLTADDPDMDPVTFDCNYTNSRFSLSDEGQLSFAPIQEDVGTYSFWIFADDGSGVKNHTAVVMNVLNVNDAPEASDITEQANDNGLVELDTTEASDEDGDELTYTWNFGDSSPTVEGTPGTPVKHNYTLDGNYTVTLMVSDGLGGVDIVEYVVEVVHTVPDGVIPETNETHNGGNNTIPHTNGTGTNDTGTNDTGNNTNTTGGEISEHTNPGSSMSPLLIIALIALILLILAAIIAVVIFVMMRKKKERSEGTEAEAPPEEMPQPLAADVTLQEQPVQAYQEPAQAQQQAYQQPMAYQEPAQAQQQAYQQPMAYQEPAQAPVEVAIPSYQEALAPEPELSAIDMPAAGPVAALPQAAAPEVVICYACGGEIPLANADASGLVTCPNCGELSQLG